MLKKILFAVIATAATASAAEYEISAKAYSTTWTEYQNGSVYSEEKGNMLAIEGSVKMEIVENINGKIKAEGFYGQSRYRGNAKDLYSFHNTQISSISETSGFETSAVTGYKFKLTDSLSVEPFAGIGYKRVLHTIAGSSGARGVSEEWNVLYAKAGIEGETGIGKVTISASGGTIVPMISAVYVINTELRPKPLISGFAEISAKYSIFKASIFYEEVRYRESDEEKAGLIYISQPSAIESKIGIKLGASF